MNSTRADARSGNTCARSTRRIRLGEGGATVEVRIRVAGDTMFRIVGAMSLLMTIVRCSGVLEPGVRMQRHPR